MEQAIIGLILILFGAFGYKIVTGRSLRKTELDYLENDAKLAGKQKEIENELTELKTKEKEIRAEELTPEEIEEFWNEDD